MGYSDRFLPESGAIFMCNPRTKEECFKGKLLGLPSNMTDYVLNVRKGTTLFLFEYESRLLHGVFRATSDGGINIDPQAFRSSGNHFPAQVRFKVVMHCTPLEEYDFKYAIRDNYFSEYKFRFGLNEKQVSKLLKLFRSNEILKKHPESRGDARSDRYRKNLFGNRLRFINKEDREFEDEDVKKIDDRVMMEKTKGKHDIEDCYTPIFTESYEKHYGEKGVGRNDKLLMDDMDCYRFRVQEEYNVSEGSRKSLSSYHLASPCDKGSQTVTDKYLFGHEKTVESEQKTLNQQSLSKPRGTCFGLKPDGDDGCFSFGSVGPTSYSCDPDIRFSPSHFADRSGFIPIDSSSFYPSPEKIPTLLPMSKSPPYHSHKQGSVRYFDDLVLDGNQEVREIKSVSQKGSYNPLFPEFISKKLSSSDAGLRLCEEDPIKKDKRFCKSSSSDTGLRLCEEDPIKNDKRFCKSRERKHVFSTDKRVSVFARLNSGLRHGKQESETDEKHELDASVNKVIRMFEKVASSPIRRKGKSKSALKDDDDDDNSRDSEIVDYDLPDGEMELDADLADEETEGKSVLPETRLLDYKRRNKSIKDVGPVEMPSKRRKIVRPSFVEKKLSADENTSFKDDQISTKVVVESSENVDATVNMLLPKCHEKTPAAKDDNNSTNKVDAFMKSMEDSILQLNSHENSPTFHEKTPSKDVSNSREAVFESSENVDAVEVEKVGKLEKPLVPDVFVEATLPVSSSKDGQKMCGWIEW